MFIVGEMRDHGMALEIEKDLLSVNIDLAIDYSEKNDSYILSVHEEAALSKAIELFRLRMGFKKPLEIEQEWVKIKSVPRGNTTFFILILCIVIYVMKMLPMGKNLYDLFFISKPESTLFYEILRGQIWRLVTPIFLHMTFFHILFNMMWFKDLGYVLEFKFQKNFLLFFILLSGVFSNILQYMVSGPSFGGMSGVLYAMLGFLWVYGKCESSFEYRLPKRDLMIMIGWLFLCLTNLLGPVANTAHIGGLFAGMLFALIKSPAEWGRLKIKLLLLSVILFISVIGIEGLKLSMNNSQFYFLMWF
jgi:GlpG protein